MTATRTGARAIALCALLAAGAYDRVSGMNSLSYQQLSAFVVVVVREDRAD